MNFLTNLIVYKIFAKCIILKDNDTTIKIRILKFKKELLKNFLQFVIEFELEIRELGFNDNAIKLYRNICQQE